MLSLSLYQMQRYNPSFLKGAGSTLLTFSPDPHPSQRPVPAPSSAATLLTAGSWHTHLVLPPQLLVCFPLLRKDPSFSLDLGEVLLPHLLFSAWDPLFSSKHMLEFVTALFVLFLVAHLSHSLGVVSTQRDKLRAVRLDPQYPARCLGTENTLSKNISLIKSLFDGGISNHQELSLCF